MKPGQKKFLKPAILIAAAILIAGGFLFGGKAQNLVSGKLIAKGNYYFNGGAYDLEKAAKYYEIASFVDRKASYPRYQLARVYFMKTDYKKGLAEIDTALAINPENKRAFYVRGLINGYAENYKAAEEDFQKFIEWAPKEWAGYNDLAWAYFKAGDYQSAKGTLERGLEVKPDNPWLLNGLGASLLALKEYSKAEEILTKANQAAGDLTADEWKRAYPGNESSLADWNLAEFKTNIKFNLDLTYNKSSKGAIIVPACTSSCSNSCSGCNIYSCCTDPDHGTDLGCTNYGFSSSCCPPVNGQCSGSYNGQSFIDSSSSAHPITATNVAQSSSQSVAGGMSADFNGDPAYLQMPDSEDWNFGDKYFTIDFWVYFKDFNGTHGNPYLMGQSNGGTAGWHCDMSWDLIYNNGTRQLGFQWYPTGCVGVYGNWQHEGYQFPWNAETGKWYHVVLMKNGNELKAFVDCSQIGATQTITSAAHNSTRAFRVGWVDAFWYSSWLSGYIDELRIAKGGASSYSLGQEGCAGHPDSLLDSDTKLLIHADGQTVCTLPNTGLCSSGNQNNLAGSGPWTWTCDGINGGSTANCSANKQPPTPGACGASNGGFYCASSQITAPCSTGSASPITLSGNTWNWTCQGQCGGTVASCNATKPATFDGSCGTADGKTFCNDFGPPVAERCSPAGSSAINFTYKGIYGGWTWTCSGQCGSTSGECSAKGKGSCGWIETNP